MRICLSFSLNLVLFAFVISKVGKKYKQAVAEGLTFETCNKVFHFSIIKEQLKEND